MSALSYRVTTNLPCVLCLLSYGVTDRLSDNAVLAGDDRLKDVWLWMAYSQQLKARATEEGGTAAATASFQGVR